jgi:hypothetical protein
MKSGLVMPSNLAHAYLIFQRRDEIGLLNRSDRRAV